MERGNPKNNFLKETASTQSAENLKIIQKPIPSFVRSKVIKKLGTICSDYGTKKLSTSRIIMRRENFRIVSKLG